MAAAKQKALAKITADREAKAAKAQTTVEPVPVAESAPPAAPVEAPTMVAFDTETTGIAPVPTATPSVVEAPKAAKKEKAPKAAKKEKAPKVEKPAKVVTPKAKPAKKGKAPKPEKAASVPKAPKVQPAKKEKPAKAPKEQPPAKAPKPEKVKPPKKTKAPKAEAGGEAPKSKQGQGGPALDVAYADLNGNERRVLDLLLGDTEPRTLANMAAAAFARLDPAQAGSWVRNALRKLVRGTWVEKVGKGEYRVTADARSRPTSQVLAASAA
jgi:hypothetical protein